METEVPRARPGPRCPLWRRDVSKVCHTCAWWTGLTFKDEHTGALTHKWHCAIVMSAISSVDVVKAANGTQAATESMRNEMVVRSGIVPLGHMVVAASNGAAPPQIAAEAPQRLIESH